MTESVSRADAPSTADQSRVEEPKFRTRARYKNRRYCLVDGCKKWVSPLMMATWECKCRAVLCAQHRFEEHHCTFDWKGSLKEKLRDQSYVRDKMTDRI